MRAPQLFASLLLVTSLAACKKEEPQTCGAGYQSATVIRGRNGCDQNGFLLQLDEDATLPLDSLPTGFQQQGLKVCLTYHTYYDPRMCPCCGGSRLKIGNIHLR